MPIIWFLIGVLMGVGINRALNNEPTADVHGILWYTAAMLVVPTIIRAAQLLPSNARADIGLVDGLLFLIQPASVVTTGAAVVVAVRLLSPRSQQIR